jgi:2-keto-4-pentenoate hydratase/2-oxohepta-3-ene-1,7-dioic acid hydratase in catechol pathway
VRALTDYDTALCYTGESRLAQPALLEKAFSAADKLYFSPAAPQPESALIEEISPERLAQTVLAPVQINAAQLDAMQRFIIGAGLNYTEHRDEVGQNTETGKLLLFPKVVEPTGPYGPVYTGVQIGESPARPVLLLDYEVELGLVLLQDVDLRNPPSDYQSFIHTVAFFTANDVSDREPIVLDPETGYTRAKSHPSYLPIGPWMIHGRHLQPRSMDAGQHTLQLGLTVFDKKRGTETFTAQTRQLSATDAMLHGPWAIIQLMSETLLGNDIICMRDADGRPRFVHDARGIIPAGSIILTGTPGGTAIQEPGLFEKLELFVRGGFSTQGAREIFIVNAEQHIDESKYLQTGDRVESWVQYLGRQRWPVLTGDVGRTYGIPGDDGHCPPGSHPQESIQP